MPDKTTITFYEIERCGYYNREAANPKFGSISSVLESLKRWTANLAVEDTKTFGSEDDADTLPTYIADIETFNGDWLIALWNEAPEAEGGVATISGQAAVGRPDVRITDKGVGRLAGFVTYFWILPNENVFATLRLSRPFTGQAAFQKYLKGFIRYNSRFVVHDEDQDGKDDVSVLGYRDDPDDAPEKLIPSFRAKLASKPGEIDAIVKQADQIRKIHMKEDLVLTTQPELKRWERHLIDMHIAAPKRKTLTEAKMRTSIDVRLSAAEVKKIAKEWDDEGGVDSGTDIGFSISGNPSPVWLSRSVAKDNFNIDLVRKMPEIFDLKALLRSLSAQRKNIVALLT